MNNIIQYLKLFAIAIGSFISLGNTNAAAQSCNNSVLFTPTASTTATGNANGVIINFSSTNPVPAGTPDSFSGYYCTTAPNSAQFYGKSGGTSIYPNTTGTYTFSIPVNDIAFIIGGGDAKYSPAETLTWSTNSSGTSVTSPSNCGGTLSGNTFTVTNPVPTGPAGSAGAGGIFVVHASAPFTQITLTHNQNVNNGGIAVALCADNIQPCLPLTPQLSNVTHPTCTVPTGSFTITNYDSSLTYTVTPEGSTTPAAVTIDPTGIVNGVPGGSAYLVTAFIGTCGSATAKTQLIYLPPAAEDCCPANAGTITRQ